MAVSTHVSVTTLMDWVLPSQDGRVAACVKTRAHSLLPTGERAGLGHTHTGRESVGREPSAGAFFANCRKATLEVSFAKIKDKLPKARKTGTTTAGEAYKDGMVSGGDTRRFKGMIAVDKNCQKYTSCLLTATPWSCDS